MSESYIESAEALVDSAERAAMKEGIARLKAENSVVGDACEAVSDLSVAGDMSESEMNALADTLADILARYNKTDLKAEFKEHFAESGGEGTPFDELLQERLKELKVIHSTDAKQGTVWRWHFTDGVQLETEVSKDGKRKHYDWRAFKDDYFDSLISLGAGEQIADPQPQLRDPDHWVDWINDLILEHSEPIEHVGPRTEAVRLLRDYVSRSIAYCDMADVRDRQGVWVDAEAEDDGAVADGGASELRIPTTEIKRICDSIGISTRGLQIELDSRGLTHEATNGVSGATYVDGVRVAYWSLSADFADPADVVVETETPAEQVQREEEEREEEERTALGAVGDDSPHGDVVGPQLPPEHEDEDEDSPDYEPGMTSGFGMDPDDTADTEDDE